MATIFYITILVFKSIPFNSFYLILAIFFDLSLSALHKGIVKNYHVETLLKFEEYYQNIDIMNYSRVKAKLDAFRQEHKQYTLDELEEKIDEKIEDSFMIVYESEGMKDELRDLKLELKGEKLIEIGKRSRRTIQ